MKTKKLTVIAILAMALVMMIGCGLVANVASISLINPPEASYAQSNEGVDASQFKVMIVMNDGSELKIPLTDSRLTVEGLVNGRLDTSTPGIKTIKITYMGISITATYVVEGKTTSAELWTVENANNTAIGQILGLEKVTEDTTINLGGATIDLSANQWPSLRIEIAEGKTLKIENGKIEGLTMTDAKAFSSPKTGNIDSAAGFLGRVYGKGTLVIDNVDFDGVVIEQISTNGGEYCKDFGVVVGRLEAIANISNVDVTDATIRGNGRIGGIIGYIMEGKKQVTVSVCNVEASLIGYNPTSVVGEEGEADKIGGIIGSVVNGAYATVDTCTAKVIINGTRDCGGLIGFINYSAKVEVKKSTVKTGSVIVLSVEGGMNGDKGKRHAGGLVGTVVASTIDVTLTGNTVQENVVIAFNSNYESLSDMGAFVGGYRTINATNIATFEAAVKAGNNVNETSYTNLFPSNWEE